MHCQVEEDGYFYHFISPVFTLAPICKAISKVNVGNLVFKAAIKASEVLLVFKASS